MTPDQAILKVRQALIAELRREPDVVVDDDRWEDHDRRSKKTYLSGDFDLEQAVAAMIASLSASGLVLVPRERLIEVLARALAAQGHSLSVDNMAPLKPDEPWGDSPGEMPLWRFAIPDAEAAIAAMIEASQREG